MSYTRVGWTWARVSCHCHFPLHPSHGYSISVSRVVNLSQTLNSSQPQLRQCRGLHGAALPRAELQELFCLAELTGHPVAPHLLPLLPLLLLLLPFLGVQTCLFLPSTPTAPQRRSRLGQAGRHDLVFWKAGTVIPSSSTGPWGTGRVLFPASIKACWLVGLFLLLYIFKAHFPCPHLSCFSLKAGALIRTTLYRFFDLSWDPLESNQKCRFVPYQKHIHFPFPLTVYHSEALDLTETTRYELAQIFDECFGNWSRLSADISSSLSADICWVLLSAWLQPRSQKREATPNFILLVLLSELKGESSSHSKILPSRPKPGESVTKKETLVAKSLSQLSNF